MPDRFFHPSLADHPAVSLDGAEAHHLIHVLRAKPGLEVLLFDGSGVECLARIVQVERSAVRLAVIECRLADRELPASLTLGVALPKGDRQKWLVEKATELGVSRLVPLVTARGVAQPVGEALRRFERAVIEASKQCGRNRLMQIVEPQPWAEFVAAGSSELRLFAHPGGAVLSAAIGNESNSARGIALAIGPEGGFTSIEAQQAIAAGWQAVDLGRRILRVETAAVALVAAVIFGIAGR